MSYDSIAGHKAVAKLLIEGGADVNAANINGSCPLYEAAIYGHADIVKLLLVLGNDAEAVPGNDAVSVVGDFTPGAGAGAGVAESM